MSAVVSYTPFTFKDFNDLDHSKNNKYLIESMDRMFELKTIKVIKERALRLLNLTPGSAVIEVGCGLGHDSEELGRIVGEAGSVVAIDSSMAMLKEARKRSAQRHIQYVHGIAESLNYVDESFNAGYADRLLVSQKNIEKVFGELVRVVKCGGVICITDIDVGSAILYPNIDGLTDLLLQRLSEIMRNPFIGRSLHVLFKKFGLMNIKIIPEAYVIRSFELVKTMIDFPRIIQDLHHLGRISRQEAETLNKALIEAEKNKDFLYGITLFTVVGEKCK